LAYAASADIRSTLERDGDSIPRFSTPASAISTSHAQAGH